MTVPFFPVLIFDAPGYRPFNSSLWENALPNNLHTKSLEEYLSYEYEGNTGTVPVMRWDNYLSLMLKLYPSLIGNLRLATHNEGDKPNYDGQIMMTSPWELPENFEYWTKHGDWILNIDLDYC